MKLLQISLLLAHEDWVYTKGWIVTVAGFLIVVIALFVLSYIFRGVAAYFTKKDEKKDAPKVIDKPVSHPAVTAADGEIPNEVLTAIGMALYLSLGTTKITELDTGNVKLNNHEKIQIHH